MVESWQSFPSSIQNQVLLTGAEILPSPDIFCDCSKKSAVMSDKHSSSPIPDDPSDTGGVAGADDGVGLCGEDIADYPEEVIGDLVPEKDLLTPWLSL